MWLPVGAVLVLAAVSSGQAYVVPNACSLTPLNCSVHHVSLTPSLEIVNVTDNDVIMLNATLSVPQLCHLSLRKNHLHTLPVIDAPHLLELDVSQNVLRVLPSAFHFPTLRKLNLSNNALSALSPNLLSGVPCIAVLDVSHNNLATLPYSLGISRRHLTQVSVAHNRLVRVENNFLDRTVVSHSLDLSHNLLRRFPIDALRRAVYIGSVNAAFNSIHRLQHGDLENVRVAALDLSGQLERVDADTFRYLPFLVNLTLTHSPHLRFLPPNAFNSLPLLRSVDLSANALLAFEKPLFWYDKDVSLNASNNPFVCHCANRWLNLTCADMSCAPLVLPLFPEEEIVALGSNLDLHCVALGAEHVRWLRKDEKIVSNSSHLHLTHAKRGEGDLFTCEASSAIGSARRSVEVTVKDPNVRLFVLSVTASFVTLAWNMSGSSPYVLRWGERDEALRSASPLFPAAPRAHSYTVHGLRPSTAYCFALSLDADVTLDRMCVTTSANQVVGVERSYVAIGVLALAVCAMLAACTALCVINARPTRTVRRVELIESMDAAFFIELD